MKIKKFAKYASITILTILLVICAIIFITKTILQNKLDNKICELRKKGYPITFKEFNEWLPIVPEDENANLIYEKANKQFKTIKDLNCNADYILVLGNAELPPVNTLISPIVIENSKNFLLKNKSTIELIEKANLLDKCSSIKEVECIDDLLVNIVLPQKFSKLLGLKSILEIENKNYNQSINTLCCSLKLGNISKNKPLLITGLVYCAGISIVNRNIPRLFAHNLNLEQVNKLFQSYKNLNSVEFFKNVYIGETCFGLRGFIKPEQIVRLHLDRYYKYPFLLYQITGLLNDDALIYIKFIEDSINTFDKISTFSLKKVQSECDRIQSFPVYKAFLSKYLSLSFSGCLRKFHQHITEVRMILTALELEKYYIKNNKYPNDINKIISHDFPELLIDPFSDNSLKYIKENDQKYKLYSFGYNMTDNGGVMSTKRYRGNLKEDYVFIIEKVSSFIQDTSVKEPLQNDNSTRRGSMFRNATR